MRLSEKNKRKDSTIPWWSRIRVRVLVFGVLLTTIPVLLISSYYLYFAKRDLQRSIQVQNNLLVEQSVQEVDALLFHTEESLKGLSFDLTDTGSMSNLYNFLQKFPMVDEIVTLDSGGRIRQGANRFEIFKLNQSKWVRINLLSTLAAGQVYYSPVSFLESGIPTVKIIVPYFTPDGKKLLGGIGAQVRLRGLLSMVSSKQIGTKIDLFLVDNSGTLIAHTDLPRVLEKTDVRRSFTVQHFLKTGDPSKLPAPNEYLSYSGQRVLGGYAMLPRTGWAVIVEQPVAVAFASINALVLNLLIFLLFMLLIAILFSIFFGLSFTRPIERLERIVRQVGNGDLDKTIIFTR
ncbi:MAG: cache domain-containing protein, partial [Desulfitobacterium hafniense]|nr:cache domain-containing protein [Desulfitobacterium hafniense]